MKKAKRISMGALAVVVALTPIVAISCGKSNIDDLQKSKLN